MPFSFQQHSQSSVELNQIEQIKQLNDLLAQLIPQLMVLKVADVHINFIDGKIDMLLRYQGYLMTLQEFMEKPNNNMLFNQNELTLLTSLKLTGDFHDFEQLIAQLPYDFSWFDTLSGVRLRINQSKAYDVSGVKYVWVMRIIQSHILSLQEIDLQNKKSVIESWLAQSQGLILITGATGSGKSTTLSAMIRYLSQKAINIITLEDPIETVYPLRCTEYPGKITQVELQTHINSFAQGLKASLRQDPDVILIGELRDLETMKTALSLAETGHLVLSTLHTRSSSQSINRLIQAFPTGEQQLIAQLLADNLIGIISQQLSWSAEHHKNQAYFEILENIPAISHLIREQQLHQIISFLQTHPNMQTMEQAKRVNN